MTAEKVDSKEKTMNQDEQYLNLLSIFHYVVGALTALFSCIFIMHIVMGILMLTGDFGDDAPPPIFAWFFVLIPSIFMLTGWTLAGFIIATGRKLKHRTSHMFCLVVAGCECLIMPFGTVLGVFTIIVLMKDSTKKLFSSNQVAELSS